MSSDRAREIAEEETEKMVNSAIANSQIPARSFEDVAVATALRYAAERTAELERTNAELREKVENGTAHKIHCNADHKKPLGCDMCICINGSQKLVALRERVEKLEKENRLRKSIMDRMPLCPDCRGKQKHGEENCLACLLAAALLREKEDQDLIRGLAQCGSEEEYAELSKLPAFVRALAASEERAEGET